jgi:hypothetical protein
MTNAKSQLALSLVSILFALEKQLGIYRQRIEELFGRHPDHDLFGSLPGARCLRVDADYVALVSSGVYLYTAT